MSARLRQGGGLLTALSRGLDRVLRFFFTPADPTPLGLIRILAGVMILYVHLAYTSDFQTYFGPDAWLDQQTMDDFRYEGPQFRTTTSWEETKAEPPKDPKELSYFKKWHTYPSLIARYGHPTLWSVWFHVTDPATMWKVHFAFLVIMFLFTIGCCTRVTSVLTWVAAMSYINRGQTSLFGMDTIMNILMVYLMIGPSGAALSVDRLLTRYWRTWLALRHHEPVPELTRPAPMVSANFALRLLQIHMCIVYGMSGLSKLQGGLWWQGTATWLTMANYEFCPMWFSIGGVRPYLEMLRGLSRSRPVWETGMFLLTYGTLAFEISFPYLIWNRWTRWAMIIGAVMMHLGIAVCMGLVTFSMMMLIGVLSFVPAETMRRLVWRLARRVPPPPRAASMPLAA
jgi:hypothetical protein